MKRSYSCPDARTCREMSRVRFAAEPVVIPFERWTEPEPIDQSFIPESILKNTIETHNPFFKKIGSIIMLLMLVVGLSMMDRVILLFASSAVTATENLQFASENMADSS